MREGAEAHDARLAGFHLDALLDRLGATRVNHERVLAVRDREPAFVEALGRQPEASVEIHRGAVGHAAKLHEAVARVRGLLARRRRVLSARLAFCLWRRLAPALVVRWRIWVDRVGRVVGVGVVVREERVEEKAAVDEDVRARMEEWAMPDEAASAEAMSAEAVSAERAVMGEPPPLRVGRGGEAERQDEGDDGQRALHRDSSPPRGGGGGGASTPPFAP